MTDTLKEILKRLREIYSDTTIHHILNPRNNKELQDADGFGACRSSCGENMKIWLKIRSNTIWNTGFWTDGCAATIACGSMATELARDKTPAQAMKVTARDIAGALKDLPEGNLHCAELAAETLRVALRDYALIQQQPWKKLYRK
ncbi:MAG: iron-sulfur cluster assembly scaffold protein [Acidobacteriota bacterium]